VGQSQSGARRKQLRYRATHRGFKEADAILGAFAALHLVPRCISQNRRAGRIRRL